MRTCNRLPFPNSSYYMIVARYGDQREVDFCRLHGNIKYLISGADSYLVIGDEGEVVDQLGDWDVDEEIGRFVNSIYHI